MTVKTATKSCLEFGYEANDHWAKLPSGWSWTEVVAVATDAQDRVYVFNRSEHPVMIFNRDGTFLRSWGEGLFARPHGIFIGPDDAVYCTDDLDHTVRKFTPDGRLLLTLGTSGKPSDTGATSVDYRTILRVGPPFHYPTNVALSPEGDIYISDGYGNARVHKFAPGGRLLFSCGEPGNGPGQFHVPHGIAVDRQGTVYVADRENSRIQLFAPDGTFLSEWTDVARPCQVFIDGAENVYIAELGFRAGMWPVVVEGRNSPRDSAVTSPSPLSRAERDGERRAVENQSGTPLPDPLPASQGEGEGRHPTPNASGGRVSIFDTHGELQARWGGGENPCAPGDFFAPHGICVDSRGDIYVAEVTMSAGGNRGLVPRSCHTLQKFVRRKTKR
ncbi:MAG: hypothetical protein HY298_04675 [Verrucomicrobia bacterium]|nr:hypothetical protein [Verrucomicrobiota bacterium]